MTIGEKLKELEERFNKYGAIDTSDEFEPLCRALRSALEGLDKCSDSFLEIRNDWQDPRSDCRIGWAAIDAALAEISSALGIEEKK